MYERSKLRWYYAVSQGRVLTDRRAAVLVSFRPARGDGPRLERYVARPRRLSLAVCCRGCVPPPNRRPPDRPLPARWWSAPPSRPRRPSMPSATASSLSAARASLTSGSSPIRWTFLAGRWGRQPVLFGHAACGLLLVRFAQVLVDLLFAFRAVGASARWRVGSLQNTLAKSATRARAAASPDPRHRHRRAGRLHAPRLLQPRAAAHRPHPHLGRDRPGPQKGARRCSPARARAWCFLCARVHAIWRTCSS